ncbi:hypothetical protein VQ02_21870 [Methylobacterium variabile]|jgi:hypothetical protein|uniref:Uncharacterized protein n=1 Tax=Methylobacterium variabile TaxID=298794 RepID=A0A0J6V2P1_9HYPH|nr:hypothetical protein VQ02_21870 [Methylobacterium variabile]
MGSSWLAGGRRCLHRSPGNGRAFQTVPSLSRIQQGCGLFIIVVVIVMVMVTLDPDATGMVEVVVMTVALDHAALVMVMMTVSMHTHATRTNVDVLGHDRGRREQQGRSKTSEDELLRHGCLQSRSA